MSRILKFIKGETSKIMEMKVKEVIVYPRFYAISLTGKAILVGTTYFITNSINNKNNETREPPREKLKITLK